VFWWVDAFLQAAIARDLRAFPAPKEGAEPAPVEQLPISV
jgi:hypothetical protein